MKFLISFVGIFLLNSVVAETVYNSNQNGFFNLDLEEQNRVWFVSEGMNSLSIIDLDSGNELDANIKFDSRCFSEWSKAKILGQWLVSPSVVCRFEKDHDQLTFINNVRPTQNYFEMAYFHQSEQHLFFVLDGREYPNGLTGHLLVKKVNKTTGATEIYQIVDDVPHFSGGLVFNQSLSKGWLLLSTIVAGNNLYEFDYTKLKSIVISKDKSPFDSIATLKKSRFPGLSMQAHNLDDLIFVDNVSNLGRFPSYFIDGNDIVSAEFPENCDCLGTYKKDWLFTCNEKSLKRISTSDLSQ